MASKVSKKFWVKFRNVSLESDLGNWKWRVTNKKFLLFSLSHLSALSFATNKKQVVLKRFYGFMKNTFFKSSFPMRPSPVPPLRLTER